MSTAAIPDRPLHAVPPPTTTDRIALLLRIRRAAHRALDLALAVPRAAAGWVIRQARTLLAGASANGLLTGAGSLLRSALGVVRAVGVIPVAATVISSPPVWRATVRAAGTVAHVLASAVRSLWSRVKGFLGRGGTVGVQISTALTTAGAALAQATSRVMTHPAVQALLDTARHLGALVAPVSRTVVVHRLLRLLVHVAWVRLALEAAVLPLLLALGLVGVPPSSDNGPATAPTQPAPDAGPSPDAAHAGLGERHRDEPGDEDLDVNEMPLNRAGRRAQQRSQAQAKKSTRR
jgi:hypothetical protein